MHLVWQHYEILAFKKRVRRDHWNILCRRYPHPFPVIKQVANPIKLVFLTNALFSTSGSDDVIL